MGCVLQVTRANGAGPVLLVLPDLETGTSFEAWRPLRGDDKVEDPGGRQRGLTLSAGPHPAVDVALLKLQSGLLMGRLELSCRCPGIARISKATGLITTSSLACWLCHLLADRHGFWV
jgi:hypothetical protein